MRLAIIADVPDGAQAGQICAVLGDAGQSRTRIYKIDLATWEIVKIGPDLSVGHANDVTYMPDSHQLIVTACEGETADVGYIVDAETLELVDQVTYPQKHPNMTYNAEREQYVFAAWTDPRDLTLYNKDLSLAATIANSATTRNYAQQCLTSDNDLIYFL